MTTSWEDYKKKKQKEFGTEIVIIDPPKPPTPRYAEPQPKPKVPLYEVRKITLPVDKAFPNGKPIVFPVTLKEATWWVEEKLKAKSYCDDITKMKTLVFYEKFLIGAPPKESSIYSNPAWFCTEEFPELKLPRRIN